ncbi:hypothetical protein ACFYRN_25195 [Streptomyces sp. NPDC005227]|uniref:hypothetical protein n=1 Tax=Streptomyces sp. NPDC005227 TaxID=3364707 RepID=UPI003677E295
MSRPARRPRVDHQVAAQQAREMPGQWVLVGTYPSTASATGAASQVRTARIAAYQPAGAFDARTELTENGTDLHARLRADQPERQER